MEKSIEKPFFVIYTDAYGERIHTTYYAKTRGEIERRFGESNVETCIEIITNDYTGYRFKNLGGGFNTVSLNLPDYRDDYFEVNIELYSSRCSEYPKFKLSKKTERLYDDRHLDKESTIRWNNIETGLRVAIGKRINDAFRDLDELVGKIIKEEVEKINKEDN